MSPFRRLLGYALRYRRSFINGLLCVVVMQAIAISGPRVLQYAIDDLTRAVTRQKLLEYGGLLFAIGIVGGYFRFLMRRILTGVSRHIEYDMRNDFFAHLQQLPLSYFQTHRTGDLMSRATNDLNAVRMMIGPSVMYSASTLIAFVASLALMFSIDARLTLFALIPLPFVSISVYVFGSAIHTRSERIQAQLAEISAVVQEALAGVRVVRAYRQEDSELDRFRRANIEYLARNRRLIAIQGLFFPSMTFFLGLGAMVVLWVGGGEVIRGRITLGEFVAFNAYLSMLAWPMIAFGWVTNMVQRGMASWKRMLEVLEAPTVVSGFSRTNFEDVRLKPDATGIEFRDLSFSYGPTPVLHNISARIPAGQTVAFVGTTGSGKSTLISLLARLHEPPPGTVFLDGVDVRDIPLLVLRGAIGFVPQEPFLFSDTLADNIAFGLDVTTEARAAEARTAAGLRVAGPRTTGLRAAETSRAEGIHRADETLRAEGKPEDPERTRRIEEAAAIARLDKDVADFPKGYATIVGERGITLSGGQKQRTAIARAVAVDPRILILDDALSAVDTYTEEEILQRLKGVMRQRTSIIVSHRVSTVRDADQIFVLDEGRIAEHGTHDELVRRDGLYADLHRKQLLEEELAAS